LTESIGLQWLHENDPIILHRDLKPSNILGSISNHYLLNIMLQLERTAFTLSYQVCGHVFFASDIDSALDFGLATVKSKSEEHLAKQYLKPIGTPLW
jgi:serine/threonine protein kinase